MFGFFKKKEQKKTSHLDKIILGAVIGGAIGSVIGVSVAPKKGSETRKEVSQKTQKLLGRIIEKARGLLRKKSNSPLKNNSLKNSPTPTKLAESKTVPSIGVKKIPNEN